MTSTVLWLACGCALVFLMAAYHWRARRFKRLDWPRTMEFYALSRRTQRFFAMNGWTVHSFDSGNIQFWAQRERSKLAVKCLPHGFDLNAAILFEYTKFMTIRPGSLLLIVSASPPLLAAVAQARAARIFLFHYKFLGSICLESNVTLSHLDELLASSLSQTQ